jgi:K+ transporter
MSRQGLWREKLFVFMLGNAARAPDVLRIPSDQVVEGHMTLEI